MLKDTLTSLPTSDGLGTKPTAAQQHRSLVNVPTSSRRCTREKLLDLLGQILIPQCALSREGRLIVRLLQWLKQACAEPLLMQFKVLV